MLLASVIGRARNPADAASFAAGARAESEAEAWPGAAHLESAGFRIFHQEENYRNLGLFEYAFIRNTWHPTMFAGA